jgi:hypothetical protein
MPKTPEEVEAIIAATAFEGSTSVVDASVDNGNWDELGYCDPAPNEEVVRILGTANDGVPVAVGLLKMIAAFNPAQRASDEVWRDISGINADALGDKKTPKIVRPLS